MEKKKSEQEEKQSIDYGRDVSAVTNEKKNSNNYTNEKTVMEEFVKYCNDKNYEAAYNLLTDECKEILYPNIEIFKINYCDAKFATKKTCSFQLWTGSTYEVQIRDNLMAEGEYKKDEYVQDYYTLNNGKINLGGLIRRESYTKTINQNDYAILKLDSIDYYMNYTNVNISMKNKTNSQIMLDSYEDSNGIVLQDNKEITEITQNEATVEPGETKKINLKFYVGNRQGLQFNQLLLRRIVTNIPNFNQGDRTNLVQLGLEI